MLSEGIESFLIQQINEKYCHDSADQQVSLLADHYLSTQVAHVGRSYSHKSFSNAYGEISNVTRYLPYVCAGRFEMIRRIYFKMK